MQIEQALQPLFAAKAQKLAKAEATPLLLHLTDWNDVLAAKSVGTKHREQQLGYAKRILREASCGRISDLSVSKLASAPCCTGLRSERGSGPASCGVSPPLALTWTRPRPVYCSTPRRARTVGRTASRSGSTSPCPFSIGWTTSPSTSRSSTSTRAPS